jgi:hypothetical protein
MDTLTDKNKKMLMDLIQGNKNVDVDNQRSTLKREKINKPLIYVGAGTCGLIINKTFFLSIHNYTYNCICMQK